MQENWHNDHKCVQCGVNGMYGISVNRWVVHWFCKEHVPADAEEIGMYKMWIAKEMKG